MFWPPRSSLRASRPEGCYGIAAEPIAPIAGSLSGLLGHAARLPPRVGTQFELRLADLYGLQAHEQLVARKDLDGVCRHLEIAESTWNWWLGWYGGMRANDAKRLKGLELENDRLKTRCAKLLRVQR